MKTAAGVEYVVPQDSSYFLTAENNPFPQFVKVKVPQGDYASISFVPGVDSLRSTMDIDKRTGILDPSGGHDDGMYWGWNWRSANVLELAGGKVKAGNRAMVHLTYLF